MSKSRKVIPFHPFLLVTYPVLSLLARNVNEVELADSLRAFIVVLGLMAVCYFSLSNWLGDAAKSALICTSAGILFFSYWHFYTLVKSWAFTAGLVGRNLILLPLWILLFTLTIWWTLRKTTRLDEVTQFLNIFALVAIGLPLATILAYHVKTSTSQAQITRNNVEFDLLDNRQTGTGNPDIYYIILDGYARADVLSDVYKYDNTAMLEFFAENGFYVAENSTSNYNQTVLSLASSLNLAYITDLIENIDSSSSDRDPLGELIRHSALREFLSQRGYQMVAFESGFERTEITDAEYYLGGEQTIPDRYEVKINPFESLLLDTTVLRAFLNVDPIAEFVDRYLVIENQFEEHRQKILFQFAALPEVAKKEGDFFVFAHVLMPHPPFVFDKNGVRVAVTHEYRLADGNHYPGKRKDYLKSYPEQLQFTNTLLRQTIQQILANSTTPPVIIVQADHGPGAYLNWESVEISNLTERFGILNVYFFPDGDYHLLYPTISPVNSFRVILNEFFGQKLAVFPDMFFFTLQSQPYDFIDVTAQLTGER